MLLRFKTVKVDAHCMRAVSDVTASSEIAFEDKSSSCGSRQNYLQLSQLRKRSHAFTLCTYLQNFAALKSCRNCNDARRFDIIQTEIEYLKTFATIGQACTELYGTYTTSHDQRHNKNVVAEEI